MGERKEANFSQRYYYDGEVEELDQLPRKQVNLDRGAAITVCADYYKVEYDKRRKLKDSVCLDAVKVYVYAGSVDSDTARLTIMTDVLSERSYNYISIVKGQPGIIALYYSNMLSEGDVITLAADIEWVAREALKALDKLGAVG